MVLDHSADARRIICTQMILCVRVTLYGSFLKPFSRRLLVLCDAHTMVITHTQIILSTYITLFGSFLNSESQVPGVLSVPSSSCLSEGNIGGGGYTNNQQNQLHHWQQINEPIRASLRAWVMGCHYQVDQRLSPTTATRQDGFLIQPFDRKKGALSPPLWHVK